MPLTLELPDETAAILKTRAFEKGLSECGLIEQLLSPVVSQTNYRCPTPQDRLRRFEAFIATLDPSTPPLSDEAVGREGIYSE